jgi:hypothetical protein
VSTFDRWQFDNNYQVAPSSTETRLSFADYKNGCHTEHHALRNKRWIPNFSDGQLRLILLTRAWLYLAKHRPMPANPDWKTLNEAATKKALRDFCYSQDVPTSKLDEHARHIAAVSRAGGLMQLWAACAYRAWKLGHSSVQVGEPLGISPVTVRQILARLLRCGRALGFEASAPHHSCGKIKRAVTGDSNARPKKTTGRQGPPVRIDADAVGKLRQAGFTFAEIGNQLGFSAAGVFAALRRASKKAGQESPAFANNL